MVELIRDVYSSTINLQKLKSNIVSMGNWFTNEVDGLLLRSAVPTKIEV
jgi:hypothetical protein